MIGRLIMIMIMISLGACEAEPDHCIEDIRAQVLDQHIQVEVAGHSLLAELADTAHERELGWKHRVCDRVAILLVPDTPASAMPVWGCALSQAIDAYFVAAGEVIAIERIEPCAEPCGACPRLGEALEVDAVLEVPAGALADVGLGAPLSF